MTQQDRIQEIAERLNSLPPAEWVERMRKEFAETGKYRIEDLMRLLGDPTKGVQVTPPTDTTCAMVTLA